MYQKLKIIFLVDWHDCKNITLIFVRFARNYGIVLKHRTRNIAI